MDIDHGASSITVRTRAKGLLGRLAHDLEIQAASFSGEVRVDGARWQAALRFPVSGLRVVGVLKDDRVDRGVLSSRDVDEIERKIQREVLRGREVTVALSGEGDRGELTVTAPRGEQRLPLRLTRGDDGRVYGNLWLSLRALGVDEIKGPLGAFKVDDAVEIGFDVKLTSPA